MRPGESIFNRTERLMDGLPEEGRRFVESAMHDVLDYLYELVRLNPEIKWPE